MASDLKRVGLIFNADGSTDFVKSLKNVNASLQENYANFKLVQSEYDSSTKTSQKLRDKLEYLNNAYDIQKQKVMVLREELNDLTNSENQDETAISKKQAALKNAETQLNKYSNQIKKTNSELEKGTADIKDFADKVNNTGEKLQNIGKKASIATGVVAGIGIAAKASFDKVDEGADNVIKATGAVGEQAESLEKSYKNVSQSIVGDFSDIGSGLGEVNTRFGFTGKTLEDCTQQFIKFAEINNTDVTTAVQLVSRAMGDASIDSSEYGTVLDALSSAAQASGISIDKLTENVTKYGAPMRALGYDTKESIALFASWEKAGVNTEIAFSGMKQAVATFSKQGKDAKVEFGKLMEQIKNAPSLSDATTIAIDKFGKKAGPDLADAIYHGRFEFEEMLNVIKGSKGTVDNTFDGLLDGSYDAELALQNANIAMGEIGDTIMTTLSPMLQKASKALQSFSSWFSKLDGPTKNLILAIGLVVAAIGPLLILIGKIASGISALIPVFSFLAANPIVLVIAGIVALVAALVALWVKCEGFRDFVTGFFNGIINFISNNWQSLLLLLVNPFAGAFKLLYDNCEWFRNIVNSVITFVSSKFKEFDNFLTNIFSTDWTKNFGAFGNVLNAFFKNIQNFWISAKQIFQGIIDFVTGVFSGNWSKAWNGIKSVFSGVFNGLLSIAKAPLNGIIGFLNLLIDGINTLIKGINKISFETPKWLPKYGGKKFGFNLKTIGKIKYLADGGTLLNGAAIVAEAGPELLLQQGNKTKVVPLSNSAKNSSPNDEEKVVINNTFNNNSKWQSPSKEAIEVRKQLQWYYITKKGRRA